MTSRRRDEPNQPIFRSVRERRLRNSGTAILALTLAALMAVLVVIAANSLG